MPRLHRPFCFLPTTTEHNRWHQTSNPLHCQPVCVCQLSTTRRIKSRGCKCVERDAALKPYVCFLQYFPHRAKLAVHCNSVYTFGDIKTVQWTSLHRTQMFTAASSLYFGGRLCLYTTAVARSLNTMTLDIIA